MILYHGSNGDFENKDIDLPTLVRKLRYMQGLTIQYFFGTEQAIKLLKRI